LVLTFDAGPQPVLWIDQSQHKPAYICLDAHCVAPGEPRRHVYVSPTLGVFDPQRGALVSAWTLGKKVCEACADPSVQMLLPHHALIGVEGLLVETLHPARVPVAAIGLRAALHAAVPALDHDPEAYGADIRPRVVE